MIILGIESSCDETSAAVFETDSGLLSNVVASQTIHEKFGGVVPELASRAHQATIVATVSQALEEAHIDRSQIDHIAVTQGPGLIGALLVGVSFARGLALQLGCSIRGINHVDAHLFASFLEEQHPAFPFLGLVVSGGHTQIMKVTAADRLFVLGKTRDDAAGEAFDKIGKMLGLAYPAGKRMDELAIDANPDFYHFPRSMLKQGLDFSFSGLKTAVLYYLQSQEESFVEQHKSDIIASVIAAITDVLVAKLDSAFLQTGIVDWVVAGGVSANSVLRTKLEEKAKQRGARLFIPRPAFCTDNAAMIAAYASLLPVAKYSHSLKPFASYASSQQGS